MAVKKINIVFLFVFDTKINIVYLSHIIRFFLCGHRFSFACKYFHIVV